MKTGITYIILSCLFFYLALQYDEGSEWSLLTFMMLGIAAIDLGMGIKSINHHFRAKQQDKK